MEEDFVTFEIAKKLKEKGFNYPCINAINSFKCTYRNGWCEYLDNREDEYITQKDLKEGDYLLPTIPQVLKWLRQEKKKNVVVVLDDCNKFSWAIQIIGRRHAQLSSHFNNSLEVYEAAAIAAIEYVIDNLI